jgi:hypothetical protein
MHVLAYNLGNFLRTLVTPETIKDLSLTTLKEKSKLPRQELAAPVRQGEQGITTHQE